METTAYNSMKLFENQVWRKIRGPVCDETMNNLRRRYNKDLCMCTDVAPVTIFY